MTLHTWRQLFINCLGLARQAVSRGRRAYTYSLSNDQSGSYSEINQYDQWMLCAQMTWFYVVSTSSQRGGVILVLWDAQPTVCVKPWYYMNTLDTHTSRFRLYVPVRILVQVVIYRRLWIGRDGHLDQYETYDISQLAREYGSGRDFISQTS